MSGCVTTPVPPPKAHPAKDKTTRDTTIQRLEAELAKTAPPAPSPKALKAATTAKAKARAETEMAGHTRAECALRDHPTLSRWLRQTPTGRLVIDKPRMAAVDGKYRLSNSTDGHLT